MTAVGRDYNGAVTTRLTGNEGVTVTLVMPDAPDGPQTPADFHRQLIRVIAELSKIPHKNDKRDPGVGLRLNRVKADYQAIVERFRDARISIPFPQRDVRILEKAS